MELHALLPTLDSVVDASVVALGSFNHYPTAKSFVDVVVVVAAEPTTNFSRGVHTPSYDRFTKLVGSTLSSKMSEEETLGRRFLDFLA